MNKSLKVSFVAVAAMAVGTVAYAQEEAAPEQAASDSSLTVAEVVIATSVEDHEPVGAAASFASGPSRLVCFVRVENPGRSESAILVSWERASGEPAAAERGFRLAVPGQARYRTFVRGSANRAAGSYRCVARAEDGTVLGSADFEITG